MSRKVNQNSPKYRAVLARASGLRSFDYHRLSADCGTSVELVRLIVSDLIRIGWVEEIQTVGMRKKFRMLPKSKRTVFETPRSKMWRSMRHLKTWTIDDLLMHSRTDLMVISDKEADDYVTALLGSKYLRKVSKGQATPPVYKLIRNTGSMPPEPVEVRVLFDPNTESFGDLPEAAQ